MRNTLLKAYLLSGLAMMAIFSAAVARATEPFAKQRSLATERAQQVLQQMTETEKLSLVRGWLGIRYNPDKPGPMGMVGNKEFTDVIGSVGYVPGIKRLDIPSLQLTDGSVGIANLMGLIRPGDVATALPSSLALASTFNPEMAYQSGAMIATEAWHKGLNVVLAPGVNLIRDPRGGRNFEYLSEDPLLSATLAGQHIQGIQDQKVVAVIKHFALHNHETHRTQTNVLIREAAMRESDLLAFELAIEKGNPGAVMCALNFINGIRACNNKHLLNGILKTDWRYPGWVMSDWGGVHGVDAAEAGLDQESAADLDKANGGIFFEAPLQEAIKSGDVSKARLDDMVYRILHTMFAIGLVDHPPIVSSIDYERNGQVALREAEEGIVLLQNQARLLPIAHNVRRIALIGGHADKGVLSGGGSAQVMPVGGPGITVSVGTDANPMMTRYNDMIFNPSPPLAALQAQIPQADIRYASGDDVQVAMDLAKWAEVVVVFATKWEAQGRDSANLSLPNGQNELISAIADANSKTVVVLETGGAVEMPWVDKVSSVLAAWYPGQRGGEAIANVLSGRVNPSGHLPITFPKQIRQYPRPATPGSDAGAIPANGDAKPAKSNKRIADVNYFEGALVGYRWFAKTKMEPLFPFGHGLSYTDFAYKNLAIQKGPPLTLTFDVTNTGSVPGSAVPQLYLTARDDEPLRRLLGFSRITLAPGETKHVQLNVDSRLLSDFDVNIRGWRMEAGEYQIVVGRSSTDEVLHGATKLKGKTIRYKD